jgi:hypothetical protein
MAIVTATPSGTIVCREKKQVIKQQLAEKAKVKAYNKRHDDFMAVGGTRVLNTYSDNVAKQIAEFKLTKNEQRLANLFISS